VTKERQGHQGENMTGRCNMRHDYGVGRVGILLLPLALVMLTGCPPGHKEPGVAPAPPLPIGEAMAIVNNNAAGITRTLSGGAMHVAAVVHDENGKVEGHPDLAGTLRFHPPHDLYLDLKHALAGTIMHVGSNDEVFWVWVKLNRDTLWYGRWADLDLAGDTSHIPLAPDMILAAMGLAPLPGAKQGLRGPIQQIDDGQYYKLLYLATFRGTTWIQREYWLDRFPPYLPRVVVFRRAEDGRIRMKSTLDHYERVAGSNVYVARDIRMVWPEQGDTFTMRLGTPTFKDLPAAAFRLDTKAIGIPRDRWIRVGGPPQTALPARRAPLLLQEPASAPPPAAEAPSTEPRTQLSPNEPAAVTPAAPSEP
jgi:hypothetical protein